MHPEPAVHLGLQGLLVRDVRQRSDALGEELRRRLDEIRADDADPSAVAS